jgi:hypothetical protein
MSPLAHIRRLRGLPRALLAVLALTVAQTAWLPCAMAEDSAPAMAAMDEHCAYCPEDTGDTSAAMGCVFPHGPTVNVFNASAHHVDVLLSSPLLQPPTFGFAMQRASPSFVPLRLAAIPSRPLNLTYCVQLK